MESVFKDNAEFWGWDGRYINDTIQKHLMEMKDELREFISPESPLTTHVDGFCSELHAACDELASRHDPTTRPSKRQQHSLTSVNKLVSSLPLTVSMVFHICDDILSIHGNPLIIRVSKVCESSLKLSNKFPCSHCCCSKFFSWSAHTLFFGLTQATVYVTREKFLERYAQLMAA